jgi:FkbM family methyltransferase
MIFIEKLKLIRRAWKYRLQDDVAEINYILSKIKKDDVVFDIGAHKGGYTYWMQKAVGKQGKVMAFEPQQKGARLLKQLFKKVIVEHIALSDTENVQTLYIQPQSYGVSFEASLENKYADYTEETITTTTIDLYCRQYDLIPSFIKIDVEGHEQKVIAGAKDILLKHKPILLVECESRHIGKAAFENLIHQLINHGYKAYFFWQKKKLPFEQFDLSIHQNTEIITKDNYANNFVFEPI